MGSFISVKCHYTHNNPGVVYYSEHVELRNMGEILLKNLISE